MLPVLAHLAQTLTNFFDKNKFLILQMHSIYDANVYNLYYIDQVMHAGPVNTVGPNYFLSISQ